MKGVAAGRSNRDIARELGRCHKTVDQEIRRNGGRTTYSAARAQARANRLSTQARRGLIIEATPATEAFVRLALVEGSSPEQIAGRIRLKSPEGVHPVAMRTIYRWLDKSGQKSALDKGGKRRVYCLRPRRKYRKRNPATGRLTGTLSIHQRPAEVATRATPGHWEVDTVVSPRGASGCLLTAVERKTRYLVAVVLPDRRAATVARALRRALPRQAAGLPVLSITSDNGKEFAHHAEVAAALGADFYFADPKSPHQRGTNENTNGLIREFLPKNRNLTEVTPASLQWIVRRINTRPRKCLNYRTSTDAATPTPPISTGDFGVAE
jgi:IS30 family transposase